MSIFITRNEPLPFEARQVTVDNTAELAAWCGGKVLEAKEIVVPGGRVALVGDWIANITPGVRANDPTDTGCHFWVFTDADFNDRFRTYPR